MQLQLFAVVDRSNEEQALPVYYWAIHYCLCLDKTGPLTEQIEQVVLLNANRFDEAKHKLRNKIIHIHNVKLSREYCVISDSTCWTGKSTEL